MFLDEDQYFWRIKDFLEFLRGQVCTENGDSHSLFFHLLNIFKMFPEMLMGKVVGLLLK